MLSEACWQAAGTVTTLTPGEGDVALGLFEDCFDEGVDWLDEDVDWLASTTSAPISRPTKKVAAGIKRLHTRGLLSGSAIGYQLPRVAGVDTLAHAGVVSPETLVVTSDEADPTR